MLPAHHRWLSSVIGLITQPITDDCLCDGLQVSVTDWLIRMLGFEVVRLPVPKRVSLIVKFS